MTQDEKRILAYVKRHADGCEPVDLFNYMNSKGVDDSAVRTAFWRLIGRNQLKLKPNSQVIVPA